MILLAEMLSFRMPEMRKQALHGAIFLVMGITAIHAEADTRLEKAREIIESRQADERAKSQLLRWSGDPDLALRSAAIVALGRLGDDSPAVLDALRKGLDYPDEYTRSNAHSALMALGDKGARTLMERLANRALALRSRLEAMMALRNNLGGLKDPNLRKWMDLLQKEIQAESDPDPLPNPSSPLQDGAFATPNANADWLLLKSNGGQGSVSWDKDASRRPKSGSLLLEKTNSAGEVVLRSKRPLEVRAGDTPGIRIHFRAEDAPPGSVLQLLLEDEKGSITIGNLFNGHAAQSQTVLQNTAPGEWEKRMIQVPKRKTDAQYHIRIVLKGNPARVWIDDADAPANPYRYSYPPGMLTKREASPPDIQEPAKPAEARVASVGGRTRLTVNGKAIPPILYFSLRGSMGDFAGMSSIGKVPLMTVTIGLNDLTSEHYPPFRPVWESGKNFNFATPLEWLDHLAANAPEAWIILNFNIHWPQDWTDSHPGEIWKNAEGEGGYGNAIHFRGFAKELPADVKGDLTQPSAQKARWWPSPFSKLAIADASEGIRQFWEAVKDKPYANRIIGCFISGGHDGQFYTANWPDYSAPAVAAFREWLVDRYQTDAALQEAWHDPSVTLATAGIPIYPDKAEGSIFLDPLTEQRYVDHSQFQAEAGMKIRDQLAEAFRKARKTEGIGMTWQMGGGRTQGAGSIFLDSPNLNMLISQPAYQFRRPGLSGGLSSPLESLNIHGKMMIKELDLRTWMRAGGEETPSYRLGTATSPEMFREIVRKEVAPMIAKGNGFWFFDISTGMFRDPEIMETAAESVRAYEKLELENPKPYQPEVALVYMDDAPYWIRSGTKFDTHIRMLDGLTPFHLKESGLVYDEIYLPDLLEGDRARQYKMIVFFDAWRLSDAERKTISEKLKNSGRYLLWNFGSGYISDQGLSKDALSELVGMTVHLEPVESLPTVTLADQDRSPGSGELALLAVRQGGSSRALPAGSLRSVIEGAKPLAKYEDGKTAIAQQTQDGWTSVYFGLPGTLDAGILSRLADEAGVHRVVDGRVLVEFNGRFLSLHGLENRTLRVTLPASGKLTDFFTGKDLGEGQEFQIPLQAGKTRWFEWTPNTPTP